MGFMRCIFGPSLYRIYRGSFTTGERYIRNRAERYGDRFFTSVTTILYTSWYLSPLILAYLYKRGWLTLGGRQWLFGCCAGVCCLYSVGILLRAVGRFHNPTYMQFNTALINSSGTANKREIAMYDFDFWAWPVEFDVGRNGGGDERMTFSSTSITQLPLKVATWLMVHTFGLKLVYPGSIRLLQATLQTALEVGRAQLVIQNGGKRYKIKTSDGNSLDVMFFDRRSNDGSKGDTLVISCEGNSGFYEIGMMATPLSMGFSTIGWNTPGFAGSSGDPYPSQVRQAADCVMQFAIHVLGFTPPNILVHGWSIGGYPSTYIAMTYPDIKGVLLDATFDELTPLAVSRMPSFMESLVRMATTDFINLNVSQQLQKYDGPVRLIRRSRDEMITTQVSNIETNRMNNLLMDLMMHRYPKLINNQVSVVLMDFLSHPAGPIQEDILGRYSVDEGVKDLLIRYLSGTNKKFPCHTDGHLSLHERTKMALFLVTHHMTEFDCNHCTPLPAKYFTLPWDVFSLLIRH